jgi:hypothetical protein
MGLGQAFAASDPREPVASRTAPRPVDAGRLPAVGLGADAGIPDGLMASLVLRPTDYLRLQVGAGSNTASPGFRGGVSLLPFASGPSFTLEAGHYMSGDAGGLVQTVFGGLGKFATYVGKVNYTFINAHAGLDLGYRDFTFFLHGGVTHLRATLSDVIVPADATARAGAPTSTTLTFTEDPVVRMWTPSVKLGVIFYLQ